MTQLIDRRIAHEHRNEFRCNGYSASLSAAPEFIPARNHPHIQRIAIALFFLLLAPCYTFAQPFAYQASVGKVSQTGYYRINLPPAVVGRLASSLGDIRLYDGKNREVPYLLHRQLLANQTTFTPYKIVSKTITPRIGTTLVLQNPARSRITSIGLTIKNTNVQKQARLSGSNDAKTWYGIEDDYWLDPVQNPNATAETRLLEFPLSDYEYYKLDINDSLSAPLNILNVGYYVGRREAVTYSAIPGVRFSQRDSLKTSLIRLTVAEAARIDKLDFSVKSPINYRRQADIGIYRTRRLRHKGQERYFDVIRSFELRSGDGQTVYLPGLKADELVIRIDNADNPPLKIDAIRASQANVYLVAELTAGQPFQLRFGNEAVLPPTYDLVYFKDKIPAKLPEMAVTNVVSTSPQSPSATTSVFTSTWLIWPAIGLVIGLLAVMSYRMLGEMGKEKA